MPSLLRTGVVSVPFARKEQEYVTGLDRCLCDMCRLEHAFSLGLVEQLVFIELASLLQVEVIAVGMSFCGIGFSRLDHLVPYGAHGESPFFVAFVGQ